MRVAIAATSLVAASLALENAVGRTPVLGFNRCVEPHTDGRPRPPAAPAHVRRRRGREAASCHAPFPPPRHRPRACLPPSSRAPCSWNTFACQVNETVMRETMDAFVSLGLRDAGYVYVGVDDCESGHAHPETASALSRSASPRAAPRPRRCLPTARAPSTCRRLRRRQAGPSPGTRQPVSYRPTPKHSPLAWQPSRPTRMRGS